GVTFLVDVMTGIPSIVAGLFGLALFIALMPDDSVRMGIMGAVALSLLMIPTVVRNSEEMLRLVPMDLREAAYALGRSEEHTSELQSRFDLVCRLLLVKKNHSRLAE